jgi:hypothetical protein
MVQTSCLVPLNETCSPQTILILPLCYCPMCPIQWDRVQLNWTWFSKSVCQSYHTPTNGAHGPHSHDTLVFFSSGVESRHRFVFWQGSHFRTIFLSPCPCPTPTGAEVPIARGYNKTQKSGPSRGDSGPSGDCVGPTRRSPKGDSGLTARGDSDPPGATRGADSRPTRCTPGPLAGPTRCTPGPLARPSGTLTCGESPSPGPTRRCHSPTRRPTRPRATTVRAATVLCG